jgi:DNA-binding GntR family transcriptional regulator
MNTDFGKTKTLSEKVFSTLQNRILSGYFKEGDQLKELELANEFGISKAPLREGLKKLEASGIIISIPRKGTYVTIFTLQDRKEIFDIRILLENSIIETLIEKDLLVETDFQQLNRFVEDMVKISKSIEKKNMLIDYSRKDIEFHQLLWEKSESKRKIKILNDLFIQLKLAMLYDANLQGNYEESAKEHLSIIKYLREKDIENCKKALKNHIFSFRKGIF